MEDLPEGAREERITVYRVCRSGKVEPSSFLPTYLDELAMTKENAEAEYDIGHYSLSTFFKENEAKRALKFFRGKQPNAILAIGCTEQAVDCVNERKNEKKVLDHM